MKKSDRDWDKLTLDYIIYQHVHEVVHMLVVGCYKTFDHDYEYVQNNYSNIFNSITPTLLTLTAFLEDRSYFLLQTCSTL